MRRLFLFFLCVLSNYSNEEMLANPPFPGKQSLSGRGLLILLTPLLVYGRMYACACLRACVHVCVRACVRVCVSTSVWPIHFQTVGIGFYCVFVCFVLMTLVAEGTFLSIHSNLCTNGFPTVQVEVDCVSI